MPLLLHSTSFPLEGVVLAISSYVGKERQFLELLANKLGAHFQEMFARRDNAAKGVLGCSHLICATNSGDKYKASVKWKIPALTRHWLIACLREDNKEPHDHYIPGGVGSVEEDSIGVLTALINEHVARLPSLPLLHDNLEESAIMSTPASSRSLSHKVLSNIKKAGGALFTTPGKPVTPSAIHTPDAETLSKLYPTPKLNDSLDEMPTPQTPYGCAWEENPSKRTRKAFKRMLDNLPENNYDLMVKKQKIQDELDDQRCKKMSDNVIKVLGFDPDETEDAGQDVNNKRKNKKDLPLVNCIIYIARKLEPIKKDLCNKVSNLGGQIRWIYSGQVTHLIFEGKENECRNKEYRDARDNRTFIVHSEWVNACYKQNIRADETSYPYCYNPNMNLTILTEKSVCSQLDKTTSTDLLDDIEDEIVIRSDISKRRSSVVRAVVEPLKINFDEMSSDANSQVERELAELEKLAANTETQGCSVESQELLGGGSSLMQQKRMSIGGGRRSSDRHLHAVGTMDMVSGSQATNIGWSDPTDNEARKRLESKDVILDVSEALDNATNETSHNITHKPQYKFVLAQSDASETDQLTEIIETLGGEVLLGVTDEMTHLITRKTTRTEKVLATIAMGKWMLSPKYLVECHKQGLFVEEAEFEFGNPNNSSLKAPTPDNGLENALSCAAHRWRTREGGAFDGWYVLLFASKAKCEPMSRVLSAGGASVMTQEDVLDSFGNRKTCYCHEVPLAFCPLKDSNDSIVFDKSHRRVSDSNFPESATHCLIDSHSRSKFDFALFVARKVPCLDPSYLCDYLAYDPPPSPSQCCVKEYKQIVANMNTT